MKTHDRPRYDLVSCVILAFCDQFHVLVNWTRVLNLLVP